MRKFFTVCSAFFQWRMSDALSISEYLSQASQLEHLNQVYQSSNEIPLPSAHQCPLWYRAAVVFDGLLCIFLVEDVRCSGDIFVDPWGRCNPQQIDDLQATGHIQNGREQIYLRLSLGAPIVYRPPSVFEN